MFRRIDDFSKVWERERAITTKLLAAVDDRTLSKAVGPEDRTLGRLAWHLTTTLSEMMARTGLAVGGPGPDAPVPASAAAIAEAYDKASKAVAEQIGSSWTDAMLETEDDMYGQKWPRGMTLFALVTHQTHHRAQMTVLMRQAGLKVPGVYGPAREDWATLGLAPPEV